MEHRGWRSLLDGSGAHSYGQLMTDDGVMVLAHGQVFDRQDVIDSLNEALSWRTNEIDHEPLVSLGDDEAALVYRSQADREGAEPAFAALMTSVVAWALASYQQTTTPKLGKTRVSDARLK